MSRDPFTQHLLRAFGGTRIAVAVNFVLRTNVSQHASQQHTYDAFGEMSQKVVPGDEQEDL